MDLNFLKKKISSWSNSVSNDSDEYALNELVKMAVEIIEIKRERVERKINPYRYDALKNIEKYYYLCELYGQLLDNCAILIKELNLKDSLDKANFLTYLMWTGYFSINRSVRYEIKNRINLDGLEALDIMDGRGVCINFSVMHKDLLNRVGVNATVIYNHLTIEHLNYQPDFEMKVKMSKLERLTTRINRKKIDHACTLIKDDNGFYVYDSTNNFLANIEDINLAVIENGIGNCNLYVGATKRYCTNEKEFQLLTELEQNYQFKSAYNRRDFIRSYETMTELALDNRNLLNSYYDDTADVINSIAKEVEKLKVKK